MSRTLTRFYLGLIRIKIILGLEDNSSELIIPYGIQQFENQFSAKNAALKKVVVAMNNPEKYLDHTKEDKLCCNEIVCNIKVRLKGKRLNPMTH